MPPSRRSSIAALRADSGGVLALVRKRHPAATRLGPRDPLLLAASELGRDENLAEVEREQARRGESARRPSRGRRVLRASLHPKFRPDRTWTIRHRDHPASVYTRGIEESAPKLQPAKAHIDVYRLPDERTSKLRQFKLVLDGDRKDGVAPG